VSRQADEIIRRAREEAAQIVRDATSATVAAGAVAADAATSDAGRAAISAFLLLEREFLQSLAGLVQGHAESVKGMAREARAAAQAPVPAEGATPEPVQAQMPEPAPEPEPEPEPDPQPERAELEVTDDPGTQAMEPVRIEEPEPAAVGRSDPDEPGEDGDRSLRELFWGEE
jgi:hypothetical protein